jgi:adenylate kinase family enzyme
MNTKAFILMGRSGCGKGTQAHLINELLIKEASFPVLYIETGDSFRSFIKSGSYTANLSKSIYENNDRQPDFLGAYMWSDMIINELKEPSHLILDGVARSVNEAKILGSALSFVNIGEVHVIYLNVTRDWSKGRLKERGRFDDLTEEAINKRLDWFDKDVLPAIEYFKNSENHFHEINGEQSIEKVYSDILSELSFLPK